MAKIYINLDEMANLKNKLIKLSDQIQSLEKDLVKSLNQLDWEVSSKETLREQLNFARRRVNNLAVKTNNMGILLGRAISDFTITDRNCIDKQKRTTGLLEKVWMGFLNLTSGILNKINGLELTVLAAFERAGIIFAKGPNKINSADLTQLRKLKDHKQLDVREISHGEISLPIKERLKKIDNKYNGNDKPLDKPIDKSKDKSNNNSKDNSKDNSNGKSKDKTSADKKENKNDSLKVSFGGAKISQHSAAILTNILKEAGEKGLTITSTTRTPHDQARIMYENIIRDGVDKAHTLYASAGDKVVNVYEKLKGSKSKNEIIKAMEEKIIELGPSKVSKHCGDPNKLEVIDISPNSITNKKAFREAIYQAIKEGKITKFLEPPKDRAYHIEIPQ